MARNRNVYLIGAVFNHLHIWITDELLGHLMRADLLLQLSPLSISGWNGKRDSLTNGIIAALKPPYNAAFPESGHRAFMSTRPNWAQAKCYWPILCLLESGLFQALRQNSAQPSQRSQIR
jgi:hypothetical protein